MIKVPYSSFNILQVGCGGTGAYLVPKIARLLMTLKQFRADCRYGYNLVDFDIIEEANLYRQNFIPDDLGNYKSDVLARRYGGHFGVDIGASRVKTQTPEELTRLFPVTYGYKIPVLIGCVDNNHARKLMQEVFNKYSSSIIYIDAGNGKLAGQVVVGYKDEKKKVILPAVGDVFPDALIEIEEPRRNCALNALENPQNIGANDMAATMIFSVVNMLLTNNEIHSHVIAFDGKIASARAQTA